MPQICDMGQAALLPLRRKACWGFFSALKNPTASAGFELANLGTKGQHATSRPPKSIKTFMTVEMTAVYPNFCTMCTVLAVHSVTPYGYFLVLRCLNFRKVNINSRTSASTMTAIIRSNFTYRNSLYQRYPAANHRVYVGSHIDWEWQNVSMHFSVLFVVKTRVQVIGRPAVMATTPRTWRIDSVTQLGWMRSCQIGETGEDR
jgi:hypothetical protein